jgi:hypothetical protein
MITKVNLTIDKFLEQINISFDYLYKIAKACGFRVYNFDIIGNSDLEKIYFTLYLESLPESGIIFLPSYNVKFYKIITEYSLEELISLLKKYNNIKAFA